MRRGKVYRSEEEDERRSEAATGKSSERGEEKAALRWKKVDHCPK